MKNLQELIKDKQFGYISEKMIECINKNKFSKPAQIRSDFQLFHFGRYVSSDEVVKAMAQKDFVPASFYELLLWPDWNGKDGIVALGSPITIDDNTKHEFVLVALRSAKFTIY